MSFPPLILASASPRRRQLLSKLVGENGFSVVTSDFDESRKSDSPYEYAAACALGKAEDVYSRTINLGENRMVLGADTVVFAGGEILGKPTGKADAARMLKKVSGAEHKVITAVCLISSGEKISEYEVSDVFIDSLTDSEIDSYIDGGSPMDKAGAYGLQDDNIRKKLKYIRGSFDNVVGLPTELLSKMLTEKGRL